MPNSAVAVWRTATRCDEDHLQNHPSRFPHRPERTMTTRFLTVIGLALACVILVPWAASAQQTPSGIAGVVKDTSGAVMPGVTVEAASPALIEKFRTVVTDGQGQYKILNLNLGTYTVTFTLTGFRSVKREGIELTAGFTATVNAE